MAQLEQNPCTIADPEAISFSFWFKGIAGDTAAIGGSAEMYPIATWGVNQVVTNLGGADSTQELNSGIGIVTNGAGTGFGLVVILQGHTGTTRTIFDSGGGATTDYNPSGYGVLGVDNPISFPRTYYVTHGLSCVQDIVFSNNTWYHIGYSYRTSEDATGRFFVFPAGSHDLSNGILQPFDCNTMVNNVSRPLNVDNDLSGPNAQVLGIFDYVATKTWMNGTPMRIGGPTSLFYAPPAPDFSTRFQLQNFQAWMGRYIDWSNPANYAAVVSLSGGHGTPAPLSAASARFGRPTLAFAGKPGVFEINQGTAGAFTRAGTLNSVDGPSF
jgi:hypothetical protein